MFYEEAAKEIQEIYEFKDWKYGKKTPTIKEIDEQIVYLKDKMKKKKLNYIHDKTTGIMIISDSSGYQYIGISLNWNFLDE